MISIPDMNVNDREPAQAGSFDACAVLSEIVGNWHVPEENESTAEPEPSPDDQEGPRFTLVELVDQEAMAYRAWGNSVGDFLARQMDEIAQLARWTQANTPDEFDARKEMWDAEIREQWEAIGYEEGKKHCLCGRCPNA